MSTLCEFLLFQSALLVFLGVDLIKLEKQEMGIREVFFIRTFHCQERIRIHILHCLWYLCSPFEIALDTLLVRLPVFA